jgi:hypothetical protein
MARMSPRDLRLDDDAGPYRWHGLLLLLASGLVAPLLRELDGLQAVDPQKLNDLARDALKRFDRALSTYERVGLDDAQFESEILAFLGEVAEECGTEVADRVYDLGMLSNQDTAVEFIWSALLYQLFWAHRAGTVHAPDIGVSADLFEILLRLIEEYLRPGSGENKWTAEDDSEWARNYYRGRRRRDAKMVNIHASQLESREKVRHLWRDLKATWPAPALEKLLAWAREGALRLDVDPALARAPE